MAGMNAPPLLVIDGATAEALVTPEETVALATSALIKTSDGRIAQDIRRTLALPGMAGTCLSVMVAAEGPQAGAKVQSVYPDNFRHGLPSHQGGVLLFDGDHGHPVALINAHAITGLRTPAASAAATRALAREDAGELAVLGYGEQADRHVDAIALVRPLHHVRVWGRDRRKAEDFARRQRDKGIAATAFGDARAAVAEADIVCTVTSAAEPVLHGAWLSPGTHVNAVGASVPGLREIDTDCVLRAKVFVDYMPMALVSASDLIDPLEAILIDRSHIRGEIGAVFAGALPGRENADEITLYRSLGVPAQDIELARFIYLRARERGLGVTVTL